MIDPAIGNDSNLYDVVTILNVDTKPFEVIYDNHSYGILNPGASKKFPRFLADHALKHLIDQILNRYDIPVNNAPERKKYAAQIVIHEEAFDAPQRLSESERVQQTVDQLNKSDLDQLIADREMAKTAPVVPVQPEVVPAPVQITPPEVPPVVPEPVAPVAPENVAKTEAEGLTKEKLYAFARDVLKMNIEDPQTIKAFDSMTVDQLAGELQYTQQLG